MGIEFPAEANALGPFLQGLDLTGLQAAETQLVTEFDALRGAGEASGVSDENFATLEVIAARLEATRTELATRPPADDEPSRADRVAALSEGVHAAAKTDPEEGDGDAKDDEDAKEKDKGEEFSADAIATTVAAAVGTAVEAVVGRLVPVENVLAGGRDLNQRIRLGQLQQFAPKAKVPTPRSEAVITASADIPGVPLGARLNSLHDLAHAVHQRAKQLGVSRTGNPTPAMVASLERNWTYTVDGTSDARSNVEAIQSVLQAAADPEILIAAGGWCAPSEIAYDFYNIVCEDGMIDIPSIGIMRRGGLQFPVSPSFPDLSELDGVVWTWTEQDDIDATTEVDLVKPCVRVDCPAFDDERLECDGFCITAGNLTSWAYPELIANWLRTVMAIRAHVTNMNIINKLVAGSAAVDHTGLIGASTASLLNSVELSVLDYRERFAMCDDDVLELILPRWARGTVRADLANRNGVDMLAVTNGMIADWFNERGAMVQYVADWQRTVIGGTTPATDYPETLQYLIYPAGTWARGSGMSLDLGVVRDSVLNATNDHTAAWSEDCYLIAMLGHQSRVVTVNVCTAGETGAASFICPDVS